MFFAGKGPFCARHNHRTPDDSISLGGRRWYDSCNILMGFEFQATLPAGIESHGERIQD
jgi:hypothetical protein